MYSIVALGAINEMCNDHEHGSSSKNRSNNHLPWSVPDFSKKPLESIKSENL